jgi:hypothetical protein
VSSSAEIQAMFEKISEEVCKSDFQMCLSVATSVLHYVKRSVSSDFVVFDLSA